MPSGLVQFQRSIIITGSGTVAVVTSGIIKEFRSIGLWPFFLSGELFTTQAKLFDCICEAKMYEIIIHC